MACIEEQGKCRDCSAPFPKPRTGRRLKCHDCAGVGKGPCSVPDCDRPAGKCRGLCAGHYDRFLRFGDTRPEIPLGRMRRGTKPAQPCKAEGCDKSSSGGGYGYCAMHHRRLRVHGDPLAHIPTGKLNAGRPVVKGTPCRIDGCDKPAKTRALCAAHYGRYLNGTLDTDTSPVRTFKKAGEGHLDKNGYRIVSAKGHPNAWASGQILEHTLVMSTYLGRPLIKGESVHHKNGRRADNRIENLELWVSRTGGSHRKGQRVSDRVADAVHTLEQYAPADAEGQGGHQHP